MHLRLQNLNLPITGSSSQLVQNLRAALGSNAATAANEPDRTGVIKPHSGRQRVQHTRTGTKPLHCRWTRCSKTIRRQTARLWQRSWGVFQCWIFRRWPPKPPSRANSADQLFTPPSCPPYRTPFRTPSQRLSLIYLTQGICRWISRPQVLEATMRPTWLLLWASTAL